MTLGAFAWVVGIGWVCLLVQSSGWSRVIRGTTWFLLLLVQLLPLFYFKYWNFVFNEIFGLGVRIPSILIPMGLSFYTFQTIGFWVDNIRNPQPRPRFLDYLNFVAFFPQIVAGPIEKRESLLPQIEKTQYRICPSNIAPALRWVVLGMAYKLIVADNIAILADGFQVDPSNSWHVWFECLAFGIRIYFDFAGYSFIAVGLGLLFGVRLTLNFRSPYLARDVREFWRNWHVTLGAWLRDYIYLPLGGRRVRWWALNTLIVFVVSGIWHGAGWGFLIWGALHGIGVALSAKLRNTTRFAWARRLVTFAFCTGAWLFFFERDPAQLAAKAGTILRPAGYALERLGEIPRVLGESTNAITTVLVLAAAFLFLVVEAIGLRKNDEPYVLLRHPLATVVLGFLTVLLAPIEESAFIYFNF